MCVYCNRLQKKSQRVMNNSHATRLCLLSYFCSLHIVMSSMIYYRIQYTHTRENVIYLLINIYMHISLIYAYFILVVHVRQLCNIFLLECIFNLCFWMLKIVFRPDEKEEGSVWLLTSGPEPKGGSFSTKQ